MRVEKTMRVFTLILLAAALTTFVQGCTSAGTPLTVLGTPRFVPQSQPDSTVEKGIGQYPSNGGIFLQWYSDQGADGYKVHRSDSTDANGVPILFSVVGNVSIQSALSDSTMVDNNNVQTGVRYYYYITAYSADGTSSAPSDTINYKLLIRPTPSYPGSNQTLPSTGLYFSWTDRTGGGYTVLRVKDVSVIPAQYVWVSARFQIYGGTFSVKQYNFDNTATDTLIPEHSYQWRVDRFDLDGTGRPYEGSKSAWSTFTVK